MFFSINTSNHKKLKNRLIFNDFFLDLDEGWEISKTDSRCRIYKGYSEDFKNLAHTENLFELKGNFCVIDIENNEIKISHQKYRTFPLLFSIENNELTNLITKDIKYKKFSSLIFLKLQINNGIITYTEHELPQKFDTTPFVNIDDSVNKIKDILIEKFKNLQYCKLPIKLYFTGGLDTGLAMAIMNFLEIKYELISEKLDCSKEDYLLKKLKHLASIDNSYLAYTQLHTYEDKCLIVSGTYGDDSFLREPGQLAIFLKIHKINIFSMLHEDSYNYHFFNRKNLKEMFLNSFVNNKKYHLNDIFLKNVNSYQHWHINNTLTFTPFQDIDILKLVINMPLDVLNSQILDCTINKRLIAEFDNSVLCKVNRFKNHV